MDTLQASAIFNEIQRKCIETTNRNDIVIDNVAAHDNHSPIMRCVIKEAGILTIGTCHKTHINIEHTKHYYSNPKFIEEIANHIIELIQGNKTNYWYRPNTP